MTKAELERKIEEGIKTLKGMLQAAQLEKRDLTRQEAMKYDDLDRDVSKWEAELEILNEKNKVIGDQPYMADFSMKRQDNIVTQGLVARDGWRSVMYGGRADHVLDKGGFKSFDECLDTIVLRPADQRTVQAGSGAEGGYAIPEVWSAKIWSQIIEESVLLGRCRMFGFADNMAGDTLHIPCWSSSDHRNGPVAAIAATWMSELGTGTPVTPQMRSVTLRPRKLMILINASRESLEDGISLASQVSDLMRQSVIWGVDSKIMRGDGVATGLGIIEDPSRVKVSRVTAGAISYDDIASMKSRLYPQCKNAIWLCSPAASYSLMTMEDSASQLVWQPNASSGSPERLLGLPLFISEHCSTLGTEGDIVLCDLSQVACVTRRGIIIESTNAVGFTSDYFSFKCLIRVDWASLWDQAITPANGGSSLSWCVTLSA